jgi:hypothetical protein
VAMINAEPSNANVRRFIIIPEALCSINRPVINQILPVPQQWKQT